MSNELILGDGKTLVAAGSNIDGLEGVYFMHGGVGVGINQPSKEVVEGDVKLFLGFTDARSIQVVINHLEVLKREFGNKSHPSEWLKEIELPEIK